MVMRVSIGQSFLFSDKFHLLSFSNTCSSLRVRLSNQGDANSVSNKTVLQKAIEYSKSYNTVASGIMAINFHFRSPNSILMNAEVLSFEIVCASMSHFFGYLGRTVEGAHDFCH